MTENKDKELLDILKSVGMDDDEIKTAIINGNIKLGFDNIEKAEKKEEEGEEEEKKEDVQEDAEEKAPESSEKEEEKIEKSQEVDLMKSFNDKIAEMETKLGNIESLEQNNTDLQKSVESLTELVESLKGTLDKMSNQPNLMKSVQSLGYFEKGGVKVDESDRTILSLSGQREEVGEALLKSMEDETDPIMKSAIEADHMNVIAGNGVPSPAVAKHLYQKGIRFVK